MKELPLLFILLGWLLSVFGVILVWSDVDKVVGFLGLSLMLIGFVCIIVTWTLRDKIEIMQS